MKRIQIIGRLAADAEVKKHGDNHILEMNVYCENSRQESSIVQVTQFHKKEPANLNLYKKGNTISAFGESKIHAWKTKEDEPRATETLYADRIHVESFAKENQKES